MEARGRAGCQTAWARFIDGASRRGHSPGSLMRAPRSTFAPSAALLPPAALLLFLLAAGAPPSGADPGEIAGAPPSGAARSEALPAAPSRGSVVGDSVTVP